ncbi:MAG: serine/threonine protein kinase [Verrucomicrobia bacterium]|nr:serine/threonine protein kinase [Verrucomicrobiota bacterium]
MCFKVDEFMMDAPFRSVPGIGVSDKVQFHVRHRAHEAVDSFVRIGEQFAAGNDDLPLAVPDRAADQPVVRELRALQTACRRIDARTEDAGGRHRPESLVLAHGERRLREGILGLPEPFRRVIRSANVERQRNGHIIHVPRADVARVTEERPAYLHQACGGDSLFRARIEEMLAVAEKAEAFIDDSPAVHRFLQSEAVKEHPAEFTERKGTRIGPYTLLQQIGEGGFGVVWMAEQTEPISRKVAVKVVKAGMDTHEVLARFEAERQALAMMDHPNIARVLEAGATASGRPYFAMELLKGIPITNFCDDQQYGVRKRLELFRDVCAAVNHAHQRGIIHRDIKPSNVMVTLHGDKPVVKVIDFGIAKATQGKLTEKNLVHPFRAVPGHARLHEPGAGRNERAGCRHPFGHLQPGRTPLHTPRR